MPWDKQFDREEALDRAMRAFWRRGYEATSIQDLVESMDINRASIYATYGDKHALFLAALRMFDDRVRNQTLDKLRTMKDPKASIQKLFELFLREARSEEGNRGCLLTNTALELAAHDPEAAKIVADAQTGIEAFLRQQIDAGRASGAIVKGRSSLEVARGLLASLVGLMVLVRSRPDPRLLESVMKDAMTRLE